KGGYFDASFHIPLIVRDPRPGAARGRRVKGKRRRHAAASLDEKMFAHPYYWAGFIYTGY
ncbi:MAG: hypothetical protein WA265_07265, partial [Rhodomicrobium sp.]